MTGPEQAAEPIVPASIVDLWNRFGWPDEDTLAAMARPVDPFLTKERTVPEPTDPMTILCCKNCGRTKTGLTGDPTDFYPSEHCGDCPPWQCETCGETCSAASLCGCWISLEGMALADIKALFAADGMFNITPDGGPTQ